MYLHIHTYLYLTYLTLPTLPTSYVLHPAIEINAYRYLHVLNNLSGSVSSRSSSRPHAVHLRADEPSPLLTVGRHKEDHQYAPEDHVGSK